MKAWLKGFLALLMGGVLLFSLQQGLKHHLFRYKKVKLVPQSQEHEGVLFEKIKKEWAPRLAHWKGQFIWDVDLDSAADKLFTDKRIKSVHLQRNLLGMLSVFIEPHDPVFLWISPESQWIPIARDGSLLPASKDWTNTPVLRGEVFGQQEDVRNKAIQVWEEFPKKGALTTKDISELHYDDKKGFVVYLNPSGVELRLGFTDFGLRLRLVQRVVQYLQSEQLQSRVIDARFSKKVVVKLRNAP